MCKTCNSSTENRALYCKKCLVEYANNNKNLSIADMIKNMKLGEN